jgi:hypothetical protein
VEHRGLPRPGPDPEMGLTLFKTFLDAGLPAPQLRRDVPVGGGPGYAYVAATVRSLLPFLERAGAVSAEEVGVDTLEDRLRAEGPGQAGQLLPAIVGAWARS